PGKTVEHLTIAEAMRRQLTDIRHRRTERSAHPFLRFLQAAFIVIEARTRQYTAGILRNPWPLSHGALRGKVRLKDRSSHASRGALAVLRVHLCMLSCNGRESVRIES